MFTYVEIPVADLERAVGFYEAVFGLKLERGEIHGHPMAFFPAKDDVSVPGALAQGESYEPSRTGPRVYLWTADIDGTIARIVAAGGEIAFPATETDEGWVAEFIDCEGNLVALHEPRPRGSR